MNLYLALFISFFKIGLFGYGGGYAMLPLFEREIVEERKWLESWQFTDIVAISQATPGPISINCATFVGYNQTNNIFGAFLATFALVLPSFSLMLLASIFILKSKENRLIKSVFKTLRPIVIGMIGAAALLLLNGENFVDYLSIMIFAAIFLLSYSFDISPIILILISGFAGILIY